MKKFILIILVLLISAPLLFAEEELNRRNVPDELVNPKRVKADDLFYARLGYGGFMGPFDSYGTSFGFGYRYEMDQVAVDCSFANMIWSNKGNDAFGFNYIRLRGLFFLSPLSNSSVYLGGGLGYGSYVINNDNREDYVGHGLEGTATLGFETMRVSTIRMFIELNATFPFNELTKDDDSIYISTVELSIGIGF